MLVEGQHQFFSERVKKTYNVSKERSSMRVIHRIICICDLSAQELLCLCGVAPMLHEVDTA